MAKKKPAGKVPTGMHGMVAKLKKQVNEAERQHKETRGGQANTPAKRGRSR